VLRGELSGASNRAVQRRRNSSSTGAGADRVCSREPRETGNEQTCPWTGTAAQRRARANSVRRDAAGSELASIADSMNRACSRCGSSSPRAGSRSSASCSYPPYSMSCHGAERAPAPDQTHKKVLSRCCFAPRSRHSARCAPIRTSWAPSRSARSRCVSRADGGGGRPAEVCRGRVRGVPQVRHRRRGLSAPRVQERRLFRGRSALPQEAPLLPGCLGRRMAEMAVRLEERVPPAVPCGTGSAPCLGGSERSAATTGSCARRW
jgi:hypothetical protein